MFPNTTYFFSYLGFRLLFGACNTAASPEEAASPPSIIFIMADDLGYGDIGPFGQEKIQTPRLDRFAAEDMTFTQFFAGTAMCAPSRAELMTGQHAGHLEIRGNMQYGAGLNPSTLSINR